MQAKAVELEQRLLQMLADVNARSEEEQEIRARKLFFDNAEDGEAVEVDPLFHLPPAPLNLMPA